MQSNLIQEIFRTYHPYHLCLPTYVHSKRYNIWYSLYCKGNVTGGNWEGAEYNKNVFFFFLLSLPLSSCT